MSEVKYIQHYPETEPRLDVIEYLLKKGANPNIPSSRRTSLDLALRNQFTPLVQLLRSYGAKTWVEMGEAGELPESELKSWEDYLQEQQDT